MNMNYPTMEPAPQIIVVPQAQATAPVMAVQQDQNKQCRGGRMGRGKKCQRNWNKPTVVTGTPEQVAAAKEEVNKYASRIHVTSIALIAIGILGMVGSIYSCLNARRGAEKWLEKAAMRKASFEAHHAKNVTNATTPEPKPEAKGAEYVSMAEFALVDNLRIIACLAFMICCSIVGMGKKGLRASWRLRAPMAQRIFKRSLMRIVFIVLCSLVIRHYAKDSIRTVRKHVGFKEFKPMHKADKHHKGKHHKSRKLQALDEEDDFDLEDQDDDLELDFQNDSQMRKFMKAMQGEIDQAEAEIEDDDQEEDNQDIETAASHFKHNKKDDTPDWMKKGLFAMNHESENGVTFEPDTKEEIKQHKKDKKHHKKHGKKDKKHHGKKDKKHGKKDSHKKKHCCCFFPLCAIALIAGHLYQLRNLATSLKALEALGANMCGYRKEKKEAAAAAAAAASTPVTAAVTDEESLPQNIEYSFDEHLDKEEYPVDQQPINYTINESSTQMQ